MFPFLEKKQTYAGGGIVEAPESYESEPGLHDIAFKAVAAHMMSAFESKDKESLASALETLCELIKAKDYEAGI